MCDYANISINAIAGLSQICTIHTIYIYTNGKYIFSNATKDSKSNDNNKQPTATNCGKRVNCRK